MKQWIFGCAAALLSLAAAGAPACIASVHESGALNRCLEVELEQRSRIAEQLVQRTAETKSSAERRRLMDEFAEWRKSTLLACSILSQDQVDVEMREIRRKICLIERTNERVAEDYKPLP